MAKKTMFWIGVLLIGLVPLLAQTQPENPPAETPPAAPAPAAKLGRVNLPADFVHAGKDYAKGIYNLFLIEKESWPYFQVYDQKNELLFEEMAIVTVHAARQSRVMRRGLTQNGEYYRVRLGRDTRELLAFFQIKAEAKSEAK